MSDKNNLRNKKNQKNKNEKAHDYYVVNINWCAFLCKKFYYDKESTSKNISQEPTNSQLSK